MLEQTWDSFDVSPQQERLWSAEPDGPSARAQAALSLHGPLDAERLTGALRGVVSRHEILRTTFTHRPGIRIPLQTVRDQLEPDFSALDLSAVEAAERGARLAQARHQELERPFDFADGPLLRALLVSEAELRHHLVLTASYLIADGGSLTLIVDELLARYGGAAESAAEPLQYADFSAWQRELQDSAEDEAKVAAEFWERARDARSAALPFAATATAPFIPAELELDIDGELAAAIEAEAARRGSDAPTFVQAAWHVLLTRLTGEDAVVGYVAGQRRHADLAGAVGTFSRPVPVRTPAGAEITFADVLGELRQARRDALVWQDYAPADGCSEVTVGYVEHDTPSGQLGELRASPAAVTSTGLALRLWLSCSTAGALGARVCFDTQCFDADAMRGLARRLQTVLAGAAVDAATPVDELALIDPQERAQLLTCFRGASTERPAGGVDDLIAAHATASPHRPAVIDEQGSITYAQLEARANQVAHRLRRAGIGPGAAVGLCTDRSVDMVVGLLGILKAGAAYVPLHDEHPPARLAHQLATAGARALLTQEPLLGAVGDFAGAIVSLDGDRQSLDGESSDPLDTGGRAARQLAYVIYTSGSTGAPKGVGVTHANVINYAADMIGQLGADAESLAFGVVTSIATDLGNTSVYGALCSGGTLVLISPATAADPGLLAAQLRRTPIDVLKITPSHASALLGGGDGGVLPRRWLVLGGERATWDLIGRVRTASECRILNHYGPTEATIGCCTYAVPDGPEPYEPATVPIGRPIANTWCYVLDDRRQLAPIGVAGRLFVGGAGVATGYVGQDELTAERFVADPWAESPDARMYDTGDLARWLPDGRLEFLGRVDEQVKIRGYRVEPAEVETALRSHPRVTDAVVMANAAIAGDARLVAYCVLDGVVAESELRAHLAQWLPEFMMPSVISRLDQMPRTPSGKIDRQALPDPEVVDDIAADYVAPSTPMEEAVAAVWADVLGLTRVGVQDDFFVLGGHSLLATQVVAQVRSDFAVDLPLHSLFTYPTISSLTAEIVSMMGDSEGEETARLMAELEGMSDDDAERLLASESTPPEPGRHE